MSIKRPSYRPKLKPPFRQCTVQDVAFNCTRLGLPVPALAMPMTEGAGNKVYDFSKEQNHGTFINDPIWRAKTVDVCGTRNISIPHSESINFDNTITLAISVYFPSTPADTRILISKGAGLYEIRFFYATYPYAYSTAWPGGTRFFNTAVDLNTWAFLTWAYDKDAGMYNLRTYINGQSTGNYSDTAALPQSNSPLVIGRYMTSSTYDIEARVADVFLFKNSLTSTQVLTLYNNRNAIFEPLRSISWTSEGAGPPQDPYYIRGTVTLNGVPQGSETVTVRNDTKGEEDTCETNALGQFIFMLNDLPTDYEDGDTIEVTAL